MKRRPQSVNICGVDYKIIYVDKPSDVDIFKRATLWGQHDAWTRTIRVFDNRRPDEDILQTLIHEIFHAIESMLHLKLTSPDDEDHNDLDILALALVDTFMRNGWIQFDS